MLASGGAGAFCGGMCGCCACLNTQANAPLVAHVRQAVLERAPLAFTPKVLGRMLTPASKYCLRVLSSGHFV